MNNMENSIVFQKVNKTYEQTKETALHDVSFSVAVGEFVSIIGLSGCGKTTVLKIIAGIENPTSGTVTRPDVVSMVFQNGALFPWLTVYDNVAIGLRALKQSETTVRKKSLEFIDLMGLAEFVGKYPRELSGGQRQRVGIARALAVNPSVLLLDEPFSALDPKTTDELHRDMLKIWRETKKTILLVSHSIGEAVLLADRIFLMKEGSIQHEFSLSPADHEEGSSAYAAKVLEIRKKFH